MGSLTEKQGAVELKDAYASLRSWMDQALFEQTEEPEEDHPEETLAHIVDGAYVKVGYPVYQNYQKEDWWDEEAEVIFTSGEHYAMIPLSRIVHDSKLVADF